MEALPPNGVKDLLRDRRTPEEIGEVLRREDCLSERGVEDFGGLVQLVEETWQAHDETVARRPAGWVGGPDHVDAIAGALVTPATSTRGLSSFTTLICETIASRGPEGANTTSSGLLRCLDPPRAAAAEAIRTTGRDTAEEMSGDKQHYG